MGEETTRYQVRIVILNYNGKDLLPRCLPSIVEAARNANAPSSITVLDNQSTDDGLDYVRTHFPDVTIWNAPQNRLLCSYNDYVPEIQEPIVIFLNNDISVDPGFIDPLVQRFLHNPDTFLVAPQVRNFDGTQIQAARTKAGMRFGMFWCNARYPGYEGEASRPSETYSSGFGAVSRDKFMALGGYDDRYLPGILEDVDLCHRAAQNGYDLYYEPKSVVYHLGQVSFKKAFGESRIATLAYRNTFLFMWKNYSGLGFWISHLFFLPFRLIFAAFKGNLHMTFGFFQALRAGVKR